MKQDYRQRYFFVWWR